MTETHKRFPVIVQLPARVNPVEFLGVNDGILRALETAYPQVTFHVRGREVGLRGPEEAVEAARVALEELAQRAGEGHRLAPDSVISAVRGTSKVILSTKGRAIMPKTRGQARYVEAIEKHTVTFGIGPAGTGKTYLAMAKAVKALLDGQVTRIILTRPAVEAGENLGFLPGTLNEKIDPYLRPLFDALHEMIEPGLLGRLMDTGTIEVAPLAYMRGRTLNEAFIILDEAQNTTTEQMKMFLTRLGFGSKVVVTGDITQIDLPGGKRSGLAIIREILGQVQDIAFCYLDAGDVVRHELVARIIEAYGRWDEAQSGQVDAQRAAHHRETRTRRAPARTEGRAEELPAGRPQGGQTAGVWLEEQEEDEEYQL